MPSAPECWTLASLFEAVGTTNRVAVEIGGAAPSVSAQLGPGWTAHRFDCQVGPGVVQAVVTPENVNKLLHEAGAPHDSDLLVIDIDGNDYWVWQAMLKNLLRSPRVVQIEYNALAPAQWEMPYDPEHVWDGSDWFGASLSSLIQLGGDNDYICVGCDSEGANAFFLRQDVATGLFWRSGIVAHPRSPRWGAGQKGSSGVL